MQDEDTGEEIKCDYCGADDDCPHLLALIDRTFRECEGGYACARCDEFSALLKDAFGKLLAEGVKAAPSQWESLAELKDLWSCAQKNYSPEDDYIEIDRDIFTSLLIELLERAGGEEYPGSINDGGGPGFSSAITLFYAKNPKEVFDRAIASLRDVLG